MTNESPSGSCILGKPPDTIPIPDTDTIRDLPPKPPADIENSLESGTVTTHTNCSTYQTTTPTSGTTTTLGATTTPITTNPTRIAPVTSIAASKSTVIDNNMSVHPVRITRHWLDL